jgi:squamous cell carcinoma antigen recognized by T-cells 3
LFQGRSKGFGYVEMKCVEDALDALSKDRQPVRDRPMFVSRCDSDKDTRRKQFQFSQGIENNKLFIRGLSHETNKETLEKLFGQHGTVKEIRIVTYR